MCSHILKVLDEMKIKLMIPEQFTLKRWTKNARARIVLDIHECEVQSDPKLEMRARYRNLCTTYVILMGKAVESKEASDFLLSHANELDAKVKEYLKIENQVIKSTCTIQVKGLKRREVSRGRKLKGCLEKGTKKKKKEAKKSKFSRLA